MSKNKIIKKIIAIVLIFTLTSANFVFVGKTYATSFVETIFGKTADTGHKNIGFEAFFGSEEEKETSIICDVNNKDLAINMSLNVQESGYLKDAVIEILSTDESGELNFEICDSKTVEDSSAIEMGVANHFETATEIIEVPEDTIIEESVEELSTENEQNVENVDEIIEIPEDENVEENTDEPENNVVDEIIEEQVPEETPNESEEIINEPEQEQEPEIENEVVEEVEQEKIEIKELYKEFVQEIEDNKIILKQIDSNSKMNLSLPIEYKNETYVKENKFSNGAIVKLTGIYVDEKGKETNIEKEYELTVSWKDERIVKVEPSVTKYIDYGAGVILQTLVKVDNTKQGNTLPIKQTELTIEVPSFLGIEPSNVTVTANTTAGTNGQTAGNVIFSSDNLKYNQEQKQLIITVNNDKKLVKYNENENEFLIDESKIVEEERIYNVPGVDEYLITYTFNGAKIPEEAVSIKTKMDAKVTTYSGVVQDNNMYVSTVSDEYEYKLEGQTGDIASLKIENETPEISKGYLYANLKNSEKYETEFTTKSVINVSYKDIIESLILEDGEYTYIDKQANVIVNPDLYYKNIVISKENFTEILGEDGQIKITDITGNEIITINKDTQVTENGNIEINFQDRIDKLHFETSKPVKEGNLVIETKKAMKNPSMDKAGLLNMDSISTKSIIKAKYNYVENIVEIATIENKAKMKDTSTKANLVINKDKLSTLSLNENVEIKIELNNNKDTSDMYGHSVFDVELPENVENVEITNASILYGEGLQITSVEALGKVIRVTVDGVQDGINSGALTNGTNIVLNANIKVNIYTPMKSDFIKLRYTNDEATLYEDQGYQEAKFEYSAPSGLVSINSIVNYKNNGTGMLTSVKQGTQTDLIEVSSPLKTAKMEMIIMNNNANTVSNLALLGRFPFEGVKDMITLESMGTTITPRIVTGITGNEGFRIYYSENAEATRALSKPENGWIENPASLENMKSYLIVPENQNYEMKSADVLRFSYDFEIPENLTREQNIYGTYLTYYTNNAITGITNETDCPDIVGLTTGTGPELKLELSSDKELIRVGEEIKTKVIVSNTGRVKVENIQLQIPLPMGVTYVSHEVKEMDNVEAIKEGNTIKLNFAELNINSNIELELTLKTEEILEQFSQESISISANVTANELGAVIEAKSNETKLKERQFEIEEKIYSAVSDVVYKPGEEIDIRISFGNATYEEIKNVVVAKQIPEEFEFVSAKLSKFINLKLEEIEGVAYDTNTKIVTARLDTLDTYNTYHLDIKIKVKDLADEYSKLVVETNTSIKGDNADEYVSNSLNIELAKIMIEISQLTDATNAYIEQGGKIQYRFAVKNIGNIAANQIAFKDTLPEGMQVRKLSYSYDGVNYQSSYASKDSANLYLSLEPNQEAYVTIDAVAVDTDGALEKTVTNYATVDLEEANHKSNSVTHIIQADPEKLDSTIDRSQSNVNTDLDNTTQISKTYRVSGKVWLDKNRNGMKDTTEKAEADFSKIEVSLVNSDTGVIKTTTTVDSNGGYILSGVENGKYIVVFSYDTIKYGITTHKREGVADNANSDVIVTQVIKDGKTLDQAVTDVITIENASISNIDMGLIFADKFDLEIDTNVTKVMIQTAKGTTTTEFDNTKLAKEEIASKYVSGATVYIEYNIKVSNTGDIAGKVKKLIDYLPQGALLNSSMEGNEKWYTGPDGNLYSTALADEEIKPGESRELKLILTKQMTADNTGIINNKIEIYEDYNIYGISDIDSTPANKAQGEDDISYADTIILIKTGEIFIYTSVIITTIILASVVVFITYSKYIVYKRRKGV